MLDWLQTWGWAAGLVWLAILVFVWPEKPDEKVRHVRNAQRLQRELFNLLIRIERLCKLYEIEDFNPSTYVYPLLDRREKLFEAAIADLVECVMDAVPQQHRAEYESFAVTGAISRLAQSQDENRSALDKEIPAGVGLELYLKRRSRKAVMPPAAPPPTKSVS